MSWIFTEVLIFIGAFIFTQLYVLPLAMAIEFIPLWIDIGIVSIFLAGWLWAIDYIIKYVMSVFRRKHEPVE